MKKVWRSLQTSHSSIPELLMVIRGQKGERRRVIGGRFLGLLWVSLIGLSVTAKGFGLPVLNEQVFSAHRAERSWEQVASSVTVFSADLFEEASFPSLIRVLDQSPGINLARTGAQGGLTSLFIRGANSNQVAFRVDGVRVNDPNTEYAPFLGATGTRSLGRVEVLRGPQSSLYGGSAVGGVVSIESPSAFDTQRNSIWIGGGSFSTLYGGARASIIEGPWGVLLQGEAERTDNRREFNEFEQFSGLVNIEFVSGDFWSLRWVTRGLSNDYQEPGILPERGFPSQGVSELNTATSSLSLDLDSGNEWVSRIILGYQNQRLQFETLDFPLDSRHQRWTFDALAEWQTMNDWILRFGIEAETAQHRGFNQGRDQQVALFSESEIAIASGAILGISIRGASYRTFGENLTGRLTFLRPIESTGGRFRATAGTGFQPPSLSDRFGSPFTSPNPDLNPEKSLGWDIGWDQILGDEVALFRVTFFQNRIRDLLVFESAPSPEPGRIVNANRARTEGIEVELLSTWENIFQIGLFYTYLEARNLSTQSRLQRRPRHSAGGFLLLEPPAQPWSGRLDLIYKADRRDSDFSEFPAREVDPGTYWDLRISARYQIWERLSIDAIVENLLDQRYQEIWGYPARGRGFFITSNLEF